MIYNFEKKFGGGSLCTRGAAGIWAMHIFSSTYFGEISIFGLRRTQLSETDPLSWIRNNF
jgi:hypothetical protein